jgi:rhamnogalacturonan endolyase
MGIAWQNTAYNQPPHLGYYLPDAMMPHFVNKDYREICVNVGDSVNFESFLRYTKGCLFTASILPDGTKKSYNVPEGFERPVYNSTQRKLTLKGAPKEAGTYGFVLKLTGLNGPVIEDTIRVVATHSTGIEDIENVKPDTNAPTTIYDAAGRLMPQQSVSILPRGLYIIREGNRTRKILVSK